MTVRFGIKAERQENGTFTLTQHQGEMTSEPEGEPKVLPPADLEIWGVIAETIPSLPRKGLSVVEKDAFFEQLRNSPLKEKHPHLVWRVR